MFQLHNVRKLHVNILGYLYFYIYVCLNKTVKCVCVCVHVHAHIRIYESIYESFSHQTNTEKLHIEKPDTLHSIDIEITQQDDKK
jgi:hypothetical protein